MKNFLALLALVWLCGCASGSHLITGTARPAVPVESVQIYQTMPTNAVVIGVVTSEGFGSSQGFVDAAMRNLKMHAAKIGGNGIVMHAPEQGSFWISMTWDHTAILKADAIYVGP